MHKNEHTDGREEEEKKKTKKNKKTKHILLCISIES